MIHNYHTHGGIGLRRQSEAATALSEWQGAFDSSMGFRKAVSRCACRRGPK